MPAPAERSSPLPEGTIPVGIGLGITGAAAYAFLIISARVIGPVEFGALSVLWALVFLIGGVFVPFEQDVSRRIVARRLAGLGGRPVVARALALGLGLVGIAALLMAVAAPWLSEHLFNGETLLVAALALGALGYLVANLTEGTLSGHGRFARYGTYLGGESLIRVAICLTVIALGVRTAGPIGLALGAAPLLMAVPVLWGQRSLVVPGPDLPWGELVGSLGSLLTAALLAQALVNGPPILVQVIGGSDHPAEVGVFTAALIIARVPLFLFQAVQAALLPGLTAMASQGEIPALRRRVGQLVGIVAVLVAGGTAVAFAIGPQVVELLFSSDYPVGHRTVGLLALASGGFIMATALALSIIALGGTRVVPIGWGVGFVTLLVVVSFGSDVLLRVELAFVSATWAATAVMAVLLRRRLHEGATVHVDDALTALNDLTFET
jgi:O-antigen/teichoic acid export membrane protein